MTTAIVTTTIRVPEMLVAYCDNLAGFGHDDVFFIVIGDQKTPRQVGEFTLRLQEQSGFRIEYWDLARQEDWLASWTELEGVIPYNSIQRRNLAFLLAAEAGAERIVSIDDDNWPTNVDFLAAHSIVGATVALEAFSSRSGWYNTGQLLELAPPRPLFHRGFPTAKRSINTEVDRIRVSGRVVINVGLWTGVPDVDAISHLDLPTTSVGFRDSFSGQAAIAPGTNMVFNTQNTAFHADLLPALFVIPMGDTVGDLTIGRHDDIWMSMFLKPIADHLGDLVAVGEPLVEQVRNEHDLFEDALVELPAMRLTNRFAEMLETLHLTGPDYITCYQELIVALEALARHGVSAMEVPFLQRMTDRMRKWGSVATQILDRR